VRQKTLGMSPAARPLFEGRSPTTVAVEWAIVLLPLVFFLAGLVVPK
jgi:hypothetical protein